MDRTRQQRWDLMHLCTIATRLTPGEYEVFRAACRHRNKSMYEVLKTFARDYLWEWARNNPEAAAPYMNPRP